MQHRRRRRRPCCAAAGELWRPGAGAVHSGEGGEQGAVRGAQAARADRLQHLGTQACFGGGGGGGGEGGGEREGERESGMYHAMTSQAIALPVMERR